ncbi:PilZ domain-containing protein [Kaarinaea lacus]
MRSFIRHPSNIPIDFQLEDIVVESSEYLKDVSVGGLAFRSSSKLEIDDVIRIKIPLVKPVFQALGRVIWSRRDGDHFEIGIEFLDKNDSFRARMVEQICHIEDYKQEVLKKEGRKLSDEAAASEWIKRYAVRFPNSTE